MVTPPYSGTKRLTRDEARRHGGRELLRQRCCRDDTIHEIITLPSGSRGSTLSAMDGCIARLNIEHYREKLAEEGEETKRKTLLRLLAEEEAKLAALDGPPKGKQSHD